MPVHDDLSWTPLDLYGYMFSTAGQHTNTGYVSATVIIGSDVEGSDVSHYFGAVPGIAIEKQTNGEDADTAPGPTFIEGSPVSWEFIVTNTGNVLMVNVGVIDDQGVNVSCPQSILDPVEAEDPSHYFGEEGTFYLFLPTVIGD